LQELSLLKKKHVKVFNSEVLNHLSEKQKQKNRKEKSPYLRFNKWGLNHFCQQSPQLRL
jgi:hypothetical protein